MPSLIPSKIFPPALKIFLTLFHAFPKMLENQLPIEPNTFLIPCKAPFAPLTTLSFIAFHIFPTESFKPFQIFPQASFMLFNMLERTVFIRFILNDISSFIPLNIPETVSFIPFQIFPHVSFILANFICIYPFIASIAVIIIPLIDSEYASYSLHDSIPCFFPITCKYPNNKIY